MSSALTGFVARSIYGNVPPDPHTRVQDNPTLLISWWCTCFSFVIILIRVIGRYQRTNRFFTEDKFMIASIIPLFVRMAFVHVVLIWGTNNTKTQSLTALDIRHREIGSRLVLASRIFYALYIWMAKYTVCEFLRRLTGMVWTRTFQIALRSIEYFLASTLVAVIIATLVECQPFNHYWQVTPDPGPQCRLGYANLLTMGVCDILTDFFLVALPVSLFVTSAMTIKRKIQLTALFASSFVLVAITGYRVPSVIRRDGLQSFRSLLASLEILAATAVSNFVVIGSFVRDRGLKKAKFKRPQGLLSTTESADQASVRRATLTHHQWGSDADLANDMGIRLDPEMHATEANIVRPAPVAMAGGKGVTEGWTFDQGHNRTDWASVSNKGNSVNPKVSPRRVSFYDVGGLLDDCDPPSPTTTRGHYTLPRASSHLSTQSANPGISRYMRYNQESDPPWQDVSGLLSPSDSYTSNSSPPHTDGGNQPTPPYYRHESDEEHNFPNFELHDAGGLLSDNTSNKS
ncbi:hypothetical protein PISL3812_06276 [Talaromyces islandicus]|uniref:Rhodopsin domain-containing protein n=1 Tax=Talaromyces islandicus TaxID=28573 RepID=A0A0U1M2K0_TALIS|nr:hypothetical protein PISL3812_06276 [Talaromyces islandicus]